MTGAARLKREDYVTGLVMAVDDKYATIKIGTYRAVISASDFAWTGRKKPSELLKVGRTWRSFPYRNCRESTARVQLEQQPAPQAAMVAIDNPTGEIKALVGGYSFEDSKFNRATQSVRQVGSSFKIYVYADAIGKGLRRSIPFWMRRLRLSAAGKPYSPRNYDEKFEGNITLRRAPGRFAKRARGKAGGKSWHQQRG